jgi:flagellar motor switch protein FliN/FliY
MTQKTIVDQFIAFLADSASKAFSTRPPAWSVTLDPLPDQFPAGGQMLTLLLTSKPSSAEAAIRITLESALVLAGALSGANSVPAQLKPEHVQLLMGIFAKACETAGQPLQLQLQLQPSKSVSWTPARLVSFTGTNGMAHIQFQVLFSADWPNGAQAAKAPVAPAAVKGVNVGVLEGVELEVMLRFGQRQLTLREIGELRSGSVFELNQLVQDPVELVLADSVIARGEVVVSDGNYALRVTEVV